MVALASRTGRHLQRYNDGCRQVVGCIPYRYRKRTKQSGSPNGTVNEDIEVLVISSQKGQAMMFPKGGWECDETLEDAARRETQEEAGVTGNLGCELGKWNFFSKSQGTIREGYMFPLLVEKQLDAWPEKNVRRRQWMTVEAAREACQQTWMKEALDVLLQRLGLGQMQRKEEDDGARSP